MINPKQQKVDLLLRQRQKEEANGNKTAVAGYDAEIDKLKKEIAEANKVNDSYAGGGPAQENPKRAADDTANDVANEVVPSDVEDLGPDIGAIGSAISDAQFEEIKKKEEDQTAEKTAAELQRQATEPQLPQAVASATPPESTVAEPQKPAPSVDAVKKGELGAGDTTESAEAKGKADSSGGGVQGLMSSASSALKQMGNATKEVVVGLLKKNWFIGLLILLGVIIIGLGLAFLVHGVGKANDGSKGTSFTQAASSYTDKDWFKKLMLYANDATTVNDVTASVIADLKTALTAVSIDPAVAPDDQAQAKILLADLDQLTGPNKAKVWTGTIQPGIQALIKKYSSLLPGTPGKFSGLIDFVTDSVRTVPTSIIQPGGYKGSHGKNTICDQMKNGCPYDIYRPTNAALAEQVVSFAGSLNGSKTVPDPANGNQPASYTESENGCATFIYFVLHMINPATPTAGLLNGGNTLSSYGFTFINSKNHGVTVGNDVPDNAIQRGDILHFYSPYSYDRTGHGHWSIAY